MFAIKGDSWRAITSAADLQDDEILSLIQPELVFETRLSPSQQIILADGVDTAVVVVAGEPGSTIDFTINGEPQSLILDDSGMDKIELSCDTPSTTILVQAGSAKAVIYAVEVPA